MFFKQMGKKSVLYYGIKRFRFLIAGCILVLLALLLVKGIDNVRIAGAQGAGTQGHCAPHDQSYIVVSGDTLSNIASRYGTTWDALATYNQIADPSLIMPGQVICIAGNQGQPTMTPGRIPMGYTNLFPYGQCTWWANERYAELHRNVYVPWTFNADAWQWTNRAYDFSWQVSDKPSIGDIIDLQSDIQGASALGHVAVVEQVLSNGDVWASTMNWGLTSQQKASVRYILFAPGPGVTFIHQ
jgi:N-acetylmuramoyl-L-alanine amidase